MNSVLIFTFIKLRLKYPVYKYENRLISCFKLNSRFIISKLRVIKIVIKRQKSGNYEKKSHHYEKLYLNYKKLSRNYKKIFRKYERSYPN